MTSNDIRTAYLNFFKARGHTIIPSAALVPDNDPTTLFTGSGMQPLLPYLLGESHPTGSSRLVDSQKCFRAEDIEEVGDNRHTTFFEMLGNWSLGDYFKEEQLAWAFEFLVDVVGLPPERLYVTAFAGDEQNDIPKDTESADIWKQLFASKGIEASDAMMGSEQDGYARGMKEGERIFYYDASKNWWSRAGKPENMPAGEPGGPDSELFYDFDPSGEMHDTSYGEHCHPNCDCGRFMEIGNSVFMEYLKRDDGGFDPLPQKNVDFGGGLERIAAASNDDPDVFTIDTLGAAVAKLEELSGTSYAHADDKKSFRIVADHLRGAVFMIADGVLPSNTEQGYFVRRLLRRSVLYADMLGVEAGKLQLVAASVLDMYADSYPQLSQNHELITTTIRQEEEKFRETLQKGLREFEKVAAKDAISGNDAFILFSTYGFPVELTEELAAERGISIDTKTFQKAMHEHQEKSRAGAEQKFKGGLADSGEKTTQLHTATHLMLAALRKYLGDHVHQAGSNITAERSRFDFTHPEKVDRETLERVEQYVNDAIAAKAVRTIEEMPKEEAQAAGVEGSFWERYPNTVHVYVFQDADGTVWSRELCGGPHVENTGDIQGTFRITKEESSSAGVRRVKATLEE